MSVGLEMAQTTGSLPVKSLRDGRGEPGLVEGKVGHLGTQRVASLQGVRIFRLQPRRKALWGPSC